MRSLATTVVDLAMFFELADDDTINPDAAVNALESIASSLAEASPDELAAVRSVVQDRFASSNNAAEREFLASFEESMGLPPGTAV